METELTQVKLSDENIDIDEKKERIRRQILNDAISGNIKNIRDKVAFILNNYISTRNSDIELAWIFWQTFEKAKFNGSYITKDDLFKLTKLSTLTRIRAKIQNEYKLFQANDKVKKYRGVLEEEKRNEAIDDKPSYPLYTIFIDETGKTQDYISVGSLWITDPESAFFGRSELQKWIDDNKIDSEFHFKELRSNKLELYKEFFKKFITLIPGAGFKVIIVKRSGLKNINAAITDLTFHLINSGVGHENDTGRAPLPRMLQVRIDDEEEGSDLLKLANIKERLVSQNIEGLYLDSFDAIDSKGNLYIQAVDLFISSINRKLHNPINNGNHKDELADYILKLLNFDFNLLNKDNNEIDKSKIFHLGYDS